MTNTAENNKRIAKNTMMLYVRMFLTMIVSLYTSRIIFNVLGASNYGIYNVVGGVVALMSFLNASMSGATSRFLTFELGKGDINRLKSTFSSAMWVHILISLVVIIVLETVGLWFLETKLVIPHDRMYAARWVYQFSILSTVIGITQVPYDACVIAHEKMNIYAYMEMLNVVLKLLIVYLLLIGNFDKLILYSFLLLCVSTLIAFLYRFYCVKNFPECHVQMKIERNIIKPMLSFSGWDLFGNLSVMARTQGVNMLLNIFFGTLINAAAGVATTVQGVVSAFGSNIVTAIRPQVIKSYSQGDINRMKNLIYSFEKIIFILLLLLSLPLMLEIQYVLKLWLINPPVYAASFCILTLCFNFTSTMSLIFSIGIHATGRMKRISLINGMLYILVLPVSYIAFKMNLSPTFPYIINVIFTFAGCLSNCYSLNLYIGKFPVLEFLRMVVVPCILLTSFSFIVSYIPYHYMAEGFFRLIVVALFSTLSIISFSLMFVLSQGQREGIFKLIKSRVCNH